MATYWYFLKCFCSIPEWFSFMRRIACARSSYVRKLAWSGLSGNRRYTAIPYMIVTPPVRTI